MFLSRLFHSDISDGEKEFLKEFVTNSKLQNAVTISGLTDMV